jgi:hypothetical protein
MVMLTAHLVVSSPAALADPPDDCVTAASQLTVLHTYDGESPVVNTSSRLENYGSAVGVIRRFHRPVFVVKAVVELVA